MASGFPQRHRAPVLRVHGTVRDTHNPNDPIKVHQHHEILATKSTTRVDLRELMNIPVYDQGSIGSCSANAMCNAYRFSQRNPDLDPSRLFLYYNSRRIEDSVSEDSGVSSIRDCIDAFNNKGICRDELWPYYKKNLFKKPDRGCYISAGRHNNSVKGRVHGERLLRHHSERVNAVDDIHQLKACLHQGSPFVFAFDVYDNFESWDGKTRKSVMPRRRGEYQGGHAVLAVGYDDSLGDEGCIIVLNSWGSDWGDNGSFYMPYSIIIDPTYGFDFWKVSFY